VIGRRFPRGVLIWSALTLLPNEAAELRITVDTMRGAAGRRRAPPPQRVAPRMAPPWTAIAQITNTSRVMMVSAQNG
jgi:hypothetical protein